MTQAQDPLIDLEIAGCKVLAKIGEGGMGSVYKAHHIMLDKEVCIKLLPPDLAKDERYVQFFLREARSVAKLEHPNIVQVYNVGRDQATGHYFLVMTYINGKNLADVIDEKGPLPIEQARGIAEGILQGLGAAHAQSIIHRDIKPSNILLTLDGIPKIVDFGLARSVNEDKQLTVAGEMVGTAYFMAPEQGLGNPVDHRADLYALGGTFFYMLSGKYPFDGKTSIEVVHKHISSPPPSILKYRPDTPLEIAGAIEKLLRKKPEERFQSAKEVLSALAKKSAAPAILGDDNDAAGLDYGNSKQRIAVGPQRTTVSKTKFPHLYSLEEELEAGTSDRSAERAAPPPPQKTPDMVPPMMQAPRMAPPPPPFIPGEGLQVRKAMVHTARRPMHRNRESLKDSVISALGYLALGLGTLALFSALGALTSSVVPQDLAGMAALAEPWKSDIPSNHLVIAALGVFLLVMTALRNNSLFSIRTLLLLPVPLLAYAGTMAISVPQPALAVSAKTGLALSSIFKGLFSGDLLPVYACAAIAAAAVLAAVPQASRLGWTRKAAAALAVLALAPVYFYASHAAAAASSPAAGLFMLLAALFAVAGAALPMVSGSSAASGAALLCFGATLVFSVGYISSPSVDIHSAQIKKNYEKSMAEAKTVQETLLAMGNTAEAGTVKFPAKLEPQEIKRRASERALKNFGLELYNSSPRNGALLLLAALLTLISAMGHFLERRSAE
ncbi:MAG: serine/threonine protein kinase [Elusimicrobia bacterium]|nr:serine/threonine protein kinase [Elusimicrobiota bacterium]